MNYMYILVLFLVQSRWDRQMEGGAYEPTVQVAPVGLKSIIM